MAGFYFILQSQRTGIEGIYQVYGRICSLGTPILDGSKPLRYIADWNGIKQRQRSPHGSRLEGRVRIIEAGTLHGDIVF
jgi:hypothetical protein